MFEPCNEKALKTLLAIESGDSISGVARKIDENRETIRRVVNSLEEAGYVQYDQGLSVVSPAVREAGLSFLAESAAVSPPSVSEAYVLPHFAGLDFAYNSIDAVYVWTHGGYQVAREPADYPLFITIAETDLEEWEQFFDRFDIPAAQERQLRDEVEGSIQYVLEVRETVEADSVVGMPVISLDETLAFAQDHVATFQPAIEMLDQMYEDVDTDVEYREKPRGV